MEALMRLQSVSCDHVHRIVGRTGGAPTRAALAQIQFANSTIRLTSTTKPANATESSTGQEPSPYRRQLGTCRSEEPVATEENAITPVNGHAARATTCCSPREFRRAVEREAAGGNTTDESIAVEC